MFLHCLRHIFSFKEHSGVNFCLRLLYGLKRILHPLHRIFIGHVHAGKEVARQPPELPLELWLEIFQFATYVHRSTSIKLLDPFEPRRTSNNAMAANTPALSIRTKLALVLVCKSWKMVTDRFLYQHLVIRSPARATAMLETILTSRHTLQSGEIDIGYGRWPIHIEIFTHARGTNNIRFLQTLFQIFRCCPNVRHLSGSWVHPLPVEFLNIVSDFYAPTLQGLCWDETCTTTSFTTTTPDFLSSFNDLRTLDLRHYVGCNPTQFSTTSPILPYVTDLILSTRPESLQIASFLSLPRVRNLTLCITLRDCQIFKPRVPYPEIRKFIEKHGHTLISVDLPTPAPILEPEPDSSVFRHTIEHIRPEVFLEPDACPNLISFVYPVTSELLPPHVHPNLRRIGLRGILRPETLYPDKRSRVKAHLEGITPELYPRLQEVRTVGFLVDAETDRYIKDVFIWWVEKFEDYGIDFLDGEGVLWAYTDPVEVDKDVGSVKVPSKLDVGEQSKEPCATPLDTPTELTNISERLVCI